MRPVRLEPSYSRTLRMAVVSRRLTSKQELMMSDDKDRQACCLTSRLLIGVLLSNLRRILFYDFDLIFSSRYYSAFKATGNTVTSTAAL